MFLLNEFRVSVILKCLGNFDQMRGPIYFIVFVPNLTVSNLGSSKIFLIFVVLVTCRKRERAVTTTWPFSLPLVTPAFRSLPFLP